MVHHLLFNYKSDIKLKKRLNPARCKSCINNFLYGLIKITKCTKLVIQSVGGENYNRCLAPKKICRA